jgi:polyisoprenoid-binding protein YceI
MPTILRSLRTLPAALATLLILCPIARAAPPTYRLEPAQSSLSFTFTQAGATNNGEFKTFETTLVLDPAQLAASRLEVLVQIASLDTGDKDRDTTLRGNELFDAAKFAQARFTASSITHLDANRYVAAGKLTIRDVTRDLRVPFTFDAVAGGAKPTANMAGSVVIKRLDYGVGQGDWKSTEWVGNDVTVSFKLLLRAAS